jgi:hypothetical protein
MRGMLSFLEKYRKRPLGPEPKLEVRQTNLKDFNTKTANNNSSGNVMMELGVEHITLRRGEVYDEEG